MIRILLVNEMLLMGNVITAALEDEPDFHVVGCVTTVDEALERCKREDPDVLLVSTRLANQGALRLTRAIAEENLSISVLLLGLSENKERAVQFFEAGATGYVLKDDSVDDLIDKIRASQDEKAYISPKVAAALIERLSELAQLFSSLETSVIEEAGLTSRELQVLELIGQGKTNQEIADQLVIEVGTAKNHVHSILDKLNVSSRSEAASYLILFKSENND
jgi:DNA-binding NarL/FixJ family response regulator